MTLPVPSIPHAWWREAVVYQVYPASFCHSGKNSTGWRSSDGLAYGDIRGIISKLDYIKDLGADVLWLSPILQSPQVDMGYDISDYYAIDERYGSMQDHDDLIAECNKRGIRYVLDLVVNHTSDQHAWFKESKASPAGAAGKGTKREWYIWRKPRYDVPGHEGERMPPNNWEAAFSGPAWTWDEASGEYYLHIFAVEQPDLNWECDAVRQAVLDLMRWWLRKGVGGFRMDVINFISKRYQGVDDLGRGLLPDGPPLGKGHGELGDGQEYFVNGPRIHEFFREIGAVLKEFDAFSVGEMPGVKDEAEVLRGVGQDRGELAMAFQFDIVGMDMDGSKWRHRAFEPRTLRIVMLAAQLALQSGTVFVYQGQELAQINVPRDWPIDKYKDIEVVNHWRQTVLAEYPDDEKTQRQFLDQYRLIGRDNARTPMQWDSTSPWAGFVPPADSSSNSLTPWMDIHPDYATWNAANLVKDETSIYHYWKKLLAFRKQEKDLIVYGQFTMLNTDNQFPDVVAYVRTSKEKKAIVIASFGSQDVDFTVPEEHAALLGGGSSGSSIVSYLRNYDDDVRLKDNNTVVLRPFEVLGAKSNKKAAEAAEKKAAQAAAKAERDKLLAEEEKGQPAKPKREATLNATGIDNALDALSLTKDKNSQAVERHPERRFKAAYKAFEERRLPEIEAENPGLRRNQRIELIKKEFEKSEENPFNQAGNVRFDATKEDIAAERERLRKGIEGRLGEK
ncbi:hypothetical protein DV738_g1607, partial [Chaetothyriales sp. CBS 135597]